ncbi:MAG: gamma carbonic anhydrase family protein [Ruminococcaceae bacterium]|nr:gamma carbonic anhydrase family protein [Oscillospiraceae bacterium]
MLHSFKRKAPKIHESAYLAPDCHVIGNVTIDENSSVWFGAVIRSDSDRISIGKGSNVQDNCTLHSDQGHPVIIGDNVTIGHNAVVHGCTIGDNTVVGMHSTVLNGAIIGKNCIIGAGAMVKENSVIPDNSLVVGIPAKVVKELDESVAKTLFNNAEEYRLLAKEYKLGL